MLPLFFIMDQPIILDKCSHPVRFVTAKGVNYYGCGHCLACQQKEHSKWRQRLLHHMRDPQFVSVFFTLTYDNEYLPLIRLSDSSDQNPLCEESHLAFVGSSRVRFRRYRSKVVNYSTPIALDDDKFQEYLNLSSNSLVFDSFPHFVLERKNNNIIYDETLTFAIASKQDIQEFFKRLRQDISRCDSISHFNDEISFFVCSEYGPDTFRPHYHGVIFCRDYSLANWLVSDGIFNSWGKCSRRKTSDGENIASIVINKSASASYISKYILKPSNLPYILQYKEFRPFHLQSIKTPIGSTCLDEKDVEDRLASYDPEDPPESPFKRDILFHESFIDKNTRQQIDTFHPFPSCFWRKIFPKFLCNNMLDDSTMLRIYRRILEFKSPDAFPDFRTYIKEQGLNSLVTNFEFTHFLRPEFRRYPNNLIHDLAPRPFDYLFNGNFIYANHTKIYKLTPSLLIQRLGLLHYPSDSDLDLFLFGFDQNRSACKKLFNIICNPCSRFFHAPNVHLALRRKFEYLCFYNSYKMMHQFYIDNIDNPDIEDYVYHHSPTSTHYERLTSRYHASLELKRKSFNTSRKSYDSRNNLL